MQTGTVKFTHTDLLLSYKTVGSYLHRIPTTVFLLNFLLCGKDRSLMLGFACDTDSVSVWCNLPVRQWQGCLIKGFPPTALSQRSHDRGKNIPLHHCNVIFCLMRATDSWDKLRFLPSALSRPCGNGFAGLKLEKGMQRSGRCHLHIQVYQPLWSLLLPPPASENRGIT